VKATEQYMAMGKKNWRILTNKEIYATVKKPNITEIIRLHICTENGRK
jgi:hypothetical protein